MESSVRWGICVLSSLLLQLGCCSISVDYGSHHAGSEPIAWLQEDSGSSCGCGEPSTTCDGDCGINGLHTVKHHLKQRIALLGGNVACSGGCGEIYWDEHINDPPVCDPCGCDGEWTGGGCGNCRPWIARLRDLWGYRYEPSGCNECGTVGLHSTGSSCSSCQNHSSPILFHESIEGSVQAPAVRGQGVPTPATPKAADGALPTVSPSKSSGTYRSQPKVMGSGVERVAKRPTGASDASTEIRDSRIQLEADKKIQAKQVSGRRRLSTQSR